MISALEGCKAILKRHTLSGEGYNLFQVLGDSRKEIMHSAMIASFLNPQGKHGQGVVFLEHFLDEINIAHAYPGGFYPEGAFVVCEKAIGDVIQTDSGLVGGRFDIFLEDKYGQKIIIENKIDAADQYKQIERYYKYDKRAHIFYLTLDGRHPSKDSVGCCNTFRCISYKKNVLGWLNRCISDDKVPVYLKETLMNYRNLLNNNVFNTSQKLDEIVEVLTKDAETLDSAFAIAESIKSIKIKAQTVLWETLKEELKKQGLVAEFFSLNAQKVVLEKTIREYYDSRESKESSKFYGISAHIGNKDGVEISLAILVDNNLYYGIVTDSTKGKTELLKSPFFKANLQTKNQVDRSWKESKQKLVVAWRYPCGQDDWNNGYNLRTFSDPLVKELAYNKTPGIIKILTDDYLHVYQEVKKGLQIVP